MQPIERLLPLLQCPRTAGPLSLAADGHLTPTDATASGIAWPVVDGLPSFRYAEASELDAEHQSAATLTRFDYAAGSAAYTRLPGLVLNLSAGNTENRPDNIIEADVVAGANTDVLLDTSNPLPFRDGTFDFVLCLNAFEHYKDPQLVADEILRVLRPGGETCVQGAFLSPLHLKPFHYFGATRHGFETWFSNFDIARLWVPPNFSPAFTLSWVAADIYWWMQRLSPKPIVEKVGALTVEQLSRFWMEPETRDPEIWQAIFDLPDYAKDHTALGFEVWARKPATPQSASSGTHIPRPRRAESVLIGSAPVAGAAPATQDRATPRPPGFSQEQSVIRTKDEIEQAKAQVVAETGAWTGHDVHLGQGVYTYDAQWHGPNPRTHQILQTITDVIGRDFSRLRILDLASGEGCLSIECAVHGAEVLSIEARQRNLAKTRLAKEMLGLDRLEIVQDDALNATTEKYGTFDVILCCGLLYHFDAPDIIPFLRRLRSMCRRFLYLDTHFNFDSREAFDFEGRTYLGRTYEELPNDMDKEDKEKWVWAGWGNKHSFVPTKASLLSMVQDAGFSSVMECHTPVYRNVTADRISLLGMCGPVIAPANWPGLNAFHVMRHEETDTRPQRAAWFYMTEPTNPHTRIVNPTKVNE